MPATYAHWRFGEDCFQIMPEDIKKIVNDNRDIFNLGVHGPDIFFYDLTHKKITSYGSKMHKLPAMDFFKNSKEVINNHEEKEQMLAYMLGFLSHFTLDSTCHSYVERKREFANISHNYVESAWERHVIELDGRTPNLVDRSESLRPNKDIAKVISYFFPFSQKEILRTTKCQHNIIYMLNCISFRKDKFLRTLLKTIGLSDFADLLIGFEEVEICKDSNLRLDKLRKKALKQYEKLLNNYIAYLKEDKKLITYFNKTFDRDENYQDIQVLSYEEELKYKV